ncbi:hypothetical protein ACFL27_03660 [candidate division CSSED10-310 bacterium]|uniref:Bulb-type lectin domain-containing protein n=1 Tax=candidate division CSSED10-310 bacterium TaxID=2855610 RepID=A0ABV6YT65_UNCC1
MKTNLLFRIFISVLTLYCLCGLIMSACDDDDDDEPVATATPTATPTMIPDAIEKTFGGLASDFAHSVQQTSDGGYILAGSTNSFGAGGSDVYLIKTDNALTEEWSMTFGGLLDDGANSVQQTSDGGYIIGGYSDSFGPGLRDIFMIKTDSTGTEEWRKIFGDSESNDCGNSVQQTSDGGYIITGYTAAPDNNYDFFLLKTDGAGNPVWLVNLGGTGNDVGNSVLQTSDGGYICAGSRGSNGNDVFLLKTDSAGIVEWSNTFGGAYEDFAHSVFQTSNGGYIVAGQIKSDVDGMDNVYLIKTDDRGNEEWSKTFGGSDRDTGNSVQQTSDGGYVVAGSTRSSGAGEDDVILIKTDNTGIEEWSKNFGGTEGDSGHAVLQTSDGSFIIAGVTESYGAGSHDIYVIKYGN